MNYYMAAELKTKVHKLTVQSPPTISTLFSNYSINLILTFVECELLL